MTMLGKIPWNKGKKFPHSKEWEERRIAAVRAAAKVRVYRRGYKRPESHTKPMLDALKDRMASDPEKYRRIAIRNLSRNRSLSTAGQNSPQWRGGLTGKMNKWRNEHRLELNSLVSDIRKRDSICRQCGSDSNLEVHHIVAVSKDISLAFDRSNAILLCHECHKKTDSFGGKSRRLIAASN